MAMAQPGGEIVTSKFLRTDLSFLRINNNLLLLFFYNGGSLRFKLQISMTKSFKHFFNWATLECKMAVFSFSLEHFGKLRN